MNKMRKGATFIEYALLAGLIAVIVALAVTFFGKNLKDLFTSEAKQTETVNTGVNAVQINMDTSDPSGK